MFTRKRTTVSQKRLEDAITLLLNELLMEPTGSERYEELLDHLERLTKMLVSYRDTPSVSPDMWASVAANLTGLLLIISHERINVITSKALGFVMRTRA